MKIRSKKVGLLVVALAGACLATMRFGTNLVARGPGIFRNDATFADGTNPWTAEYLASLASFTSLRTMQWTATNGSTMSRWDQRRSRFDDQSQGIWSLDVAVEWIIDLCNRLDCDMWYNIPHLTASASDGNTPNDFALRLSILVKTGVDVTGVNLTPLGSDLSSLSADDFIAAGGTRTCQPLKSSLRFFIEYSNETWNTYYVWFPQTRYCREQGLQMNLDANEELAGYRFSGFAAIRIFRAAEMVFGVDNPRLVNVIAGFVSNSASYGNQLYMVGNAQYNPWGTQADAVAVAPYFGGGASTIDGLRSDISRAQSSSAGCYSLASRAGLQLLAYEGGQHVTTNGISVNRDSRTYQIYLDYFDAISQYYTEFSHYQHIHHSTSYRDDNAFGSMEYLGQPLSQTHKYRAILDWIADNPVSTERGHGYRVTTGQQAGAGAAAPIPRECFDLKGRGVLRGMYGNAIWTPATGLYIVRGWANEPARPFTVLVR